MSGEKSIIRCNACLTTGTFPISWKRQRLVNKVAERITKAWSGNLKSCKVCILLTLDVEHAFNSANWEDILDALERCFEAKQENLAIIDDYLDKRTLIAETTNGPQQYDITAGVPRGSIMGPNLWNVDYNELLEIPLPKHVELTSFAHDVAATIVA